MTTHNPLPVIIDIEASGFGAGSYPVEIGLALSDGSSHCFLVKPQIEWTHWDNDGEALHKISRATLARFGRPAHDVAVELNTLLRGEVVYSDGWGFDLPWLYRLYESVDMTPWFRLDTLTTLLSEEQMKQWDSVKRQIFAELNFRRHRASNDARVLQLTYQRTLHNQSFE